MDVVAYAKEGKDKTPYTEQSLMDSISKLTELCCKNQNSILSAQIETSDDVSEKVALINQKIKNKRKQNELKKSRRK